MIIPVCTLLTETSPQALPLGAACIVAAINAHFAKFANSNSEEQKIQAKLAVFSAEDNPTPDFVAKELLAQNPPAICFSVYVWNYKFFSDVANIIRKVANNVFIIAGGPEITAHPASCTEFDYVVSGEGEEQVPLLLEKLILQKQANISRHIHGSRVAPEKLISPYLSGTLNPKDYSGGALWELARGCPFKCAYCYESKGEKTVSHIPMNRIKAELDFFKQKGVSQVFVLDPTYNANKQKALELLRYIKKVAPEIFFHFECRAEFLDKELAKAFANISCSLQIGLQSSHKHVLNLVNRNFDKQNFVRKINLLNASGAIFGFDLIYGLPGDTLNGFKESLDFAISLYPNNLEIFRLSVLPGTTLYDDGEKLQLIAQNAPPYHIQSTSTFTQRDLTKAEKLAQAASIFYSQGRAVSWFISLLKPLKQKPSSFFEEFSTSNAVSQNCVCIKHQEIEKLQIDYIKKRYLQSNLKQILPAALDLIRINGAMSRAYAENLSTELHLSYHPEDLLSPYAQDIIFFAKNAKKFSCNVKIFPGKHGPQWQL
ncbi:MAG: radical SAM protein [Spirochaetaceae bacterium]|nr:radical SAM protein [Spirochaetaceae bacterium]